MSIIDDINKHQPAWEGETADGMKKKIFVIVGNISNEEKINKNKYDKNFK